MSKPFEKMMEDEYGVKFVDVTPKENTDLREQEEIHRILAWFSFQVDEGRGVTGMKEAKESIEKLVHQARVEELAEISLRFSRFTWGHYNPSSIFKERIKELESKEEA